MRNMLTAAAALALLAGVSAPAFAQSSDGRGDYNRGDYSRNGAERRDNDRRNDNNAAAAGVAGFAVGAALAGNNGAVRLYAPGYAYPAYGQSGYGDPRSDPRYGEGGYAFGHRAGQWVPIGERAQWLDQRIDRGAQQGTLDQGDVRSLRRELSSLERTERNYRRNGLQAWEMADLDKRFDRLAARIQYERTDGDNGRAYRRDR